MAKQQGPNKADEKILSRYLELSKQLEISTEQRLKLNDRVQKGEFATVKAMEQAAIKSERLTLLANKRQKDAEKQANIEQKIEDSLQGQYDLSEDLENQAKSIVKSHGDILNVSRDEVKEAQKKIKTDKAHIKYQIQTGQLTGDALAMAKANLDVLDEQANQYDHIQGSLDSPAYQRIKKQMDVNVEAAEKLGGALDSAFASIPGGNFLGKALGLDDAKKKLTDGVVAGFKNMNAEMVNGKGGLAALKAGAKGFNAGLMVNPLLLVVAAAAGLFALLSDVEKKAQEFSKSTGMDVAQSKQLVKEVENRDVAMGNNLAKSEDILAVQEQMIQKMGTAGKLSVEMATHVAETAKMFGYAASEAAGVQESFEILGASSEEAAKMQRDLGVEAFKSGVNVGAVMKDVAENSDDAMRYMAGGAKELAKAALEGAKMGMNLKQMTKIADGLLDIESSLTAQFEFQALTGRQLNLDKARELALTGDIVGASKEVLEQVGSAADFNKLNSIEKKKLAEATGMEVGELAKTLTLQEKLGDLSKEQAAAAQSLGLSAEEMKNMSNEELAAEIEKEQAAQQTGKAMEDIVRTLKQALLPLAEAFGSALTMILPIIKAILWPIQQIGNLFGMLNEKAPILASVLKIIGGLMLANWLYSKYQVHQEKKKNQKKLEAFELQQRINEMEAHNNSLLDQQNKKKDKELATEKQITKQAEAQVKAQKTENDLSGKALQQKQAQSKPKGMLGKLTGGKFGKALGLQEGGLLNKLGGGAKSLGGKAMGMMGGGGSMMSMIPGFATGGEVESTGVAKVHAGEMIKPASKVSGSERAASSEGGGGGGIDYDKMTKAFIAAMQQMPAPQVNMDGKAISDSVSAQQSYDKGFSK